MDLFASDTNVVANVLFGIESRDCETVLFIRDLMRDAYDIVTLVSNASIRELGGGCADISVLTFLAVNGHRAYNGSIRVFLYKKLWDLWLEERELEIELGRAL